MDKLLLTAFLSSLAGFLTAILSIVKLVNEKESKTSEYRQAWTDSARKSLADLVGLINTLASLSWNIMKDADTMESAMLSSIENSKDENVELFKKFMQDKIQNQHATRREITRDLHQTYAMTRLHFRLNDHDFGKIEQSFPHIYTMLESLATEDDSEKRTKLKEKIHAAADELIVYSRILLKTEWEIVKKGEKAFLQTKRWTIYGSIVMLFILVSIGIHAAISMWKDDIKKPNEQNFQQTPTLLAPRTLESAQTFTQPIINNTTPLPIQITNSAWCGNAVPQQNRAALAPTPKSSIAPTPECAQK
ncbi:hypothetical protein [Janthinobacterium sp.]|uniref:hypothetical protein n=1 Tax=Janthinobacterium sp. TaxID=1871054 RepID=UPI0028A16CAA|nr:hypothetical protein [Janthinobacterium sp.]